MEDRLYLMSGSELYSLSDLVEIKEGKLQKFLANAVNTYAKHITQECRLCMEKGFLCEYCYDPTPIYPFEIQTVVQCRRCKGFFHIKCFKSGAPCPRCTRLRERRSSMAVIEGTS